MTLLVTTPSLAKATVISAIDAFSLALQGLTNESGIPYPVPLKILAAYNDETPVYPTLTVDYVSGGSVEGMGGNLIEVDQAAMALTYGQYDVGGTLTLTIRSRKPAERAWLYDWFDSAIRAAFVSDSTTGEIIPGAVQLYLINCGIQVNEIARMDKPPPILTDPRPAGQRYDIMLALDVDVQLTWQPAIPPGGLLQITSIVLNPAALTPSGQTLTDPEVTVTTPSD